jgi:hypothetical protein
VLPLVPKPVGEGREGRTGASLAEAEGNVVAEEGGLGRGESCYDVFLFFFERRLRKRKNGAASMLDVR